MSDSIYNKFVANSGKVLRYGGKGLVLGMKAGFSVGVCKGCMYWYAYTESKKGSSSATNVAEGVIKRGVKIGGSILGYPISMSTLGCFGIVVGAQVGFQWGIAYGICQVTGLNAAINQRVEKILTIEHPVGNNASRATTMLNSFKSGAKQSIATLSRPPYCKAVAACGIAAVLMLEYDMAFSAKPAPSSKQPSIAAPR